jgi:hypothetical protein
VKRRAVGRLILSVTAPIAASAVVLSAVACGGGSGGGGGAGGTATDTEPPPLAQVSTAAPVPSVTAKPGPVIEAACPLLSPAVIASALGLRRPAAAERPAVKTSGSTLVGCHYQSGGQYVELWVAISPLSGTADQAASLAIRRYSGTLNSVPGVGDAAYYTDSTLSRAGPRPQALVAARAEGRQMRVVTFSTFLGGNPKEKIVTLARAVLERI